LKALVILSSVLILGIFSIPAFADNSTKHGLSYYHPGIMWDWNIRAQNYTFDVNTVSNYNMKNVTFDKDTKTLTFLGNSSHAGNIAEIQFPHQLIGGNYTVYLNDKQIFPLIIHSGSNTLIVLKFNDTGFTTTNVVGTTYLPEFAGIAPLIMVISFAVLFLTLKVGKL
jgi:hypothetical protein